MYDLLKISYKKEELAWLGPTHLLSTHLGMYNSSEGQGQKKRSVDPEISSWNCVYSLPDSTAPL